MCVPGPPRHQGEHKPHCLPGWGSAGPLGGDCGLWPLCWAQELFLPCLERGRRRGGDTVLGRGACPGRVLPLPSHSFHPSAGRGWWAAQGDSRDLLCPVCQWHSPRYKAIRKTGPQSRFNQLVVSGCAHTSACVSRLLLPPLLSRSVSDRACGC